MARSFNGSSAFITPSVGGLSAIGASTPTTIAAIVKLNDTTDGAVVYCATSTIGNPTCFLECFGGNWTYSTNSSTVPNLFAAATADNWTLIVGSKAGGSATPRGHKYVYDTNTWTHANGDDSTGNGAGNTANVRIGRWGSASEYFNGDIAIAAVWNRVLSDAEVENLAFSFQAWVAAAPIAGWLLDQSATSQTLVDWTGGGANESAITGTSVATAAVPVFSYGHPVLLSPSAGDPDATVTPSAIAVSASVPSPVVSGAALVTPSAIAAAASVPAVTVTAGGALVLPSAILAAASIPAPASMSSAVAAAAILAAASIPTPSVSTVAAPPFEAVIRIARGYGSDSDLSALSDSDWTDVTEWVRYAPGVNIRAGRHGIGSQTDPLTVRLTLDNRDGRFTPFHRSGAYWPDIVRGLPLQVQVSADGGPAVELATAFIDEFELGWDESTNDAVVYVVAQGRLFYLTRTAPTTTEGSSGSGLRGAILASGPLAYWPLEDGTSATKAASAISGVAAMSKSGTLHFGTGDGGPGSDPILDLSESGTSGSLTGTVPTQTSSPSSIRFAFVATFPDGGAVGDVIQFAQVSTAGSITGWWVNYSHSGPSTQLEIGYSRNDGGTAWLNDTNATPYDGVAYWYLLELVQDGADIDAVLYRNGTALISDTVTGATLGRPTALRATSPGGAQAPAIGHYAVWVDETPSTADILAAFGVDPDSGAQTSGSYAGESAGDRIQRLCDAAGIPVQVGAGATSAMGPQGSGSLIDVLRECEAADGGLLHDAGPLGSLVYIPRTARYNAPIDMTVDVDLRHLSPGFRPRLDGRDRLTSLTVSQPQGSSGSYTAGGGESTAERSVTLNLSDDEDLDQHAAWRVGVGTTQGMRYPRVELDMRRSTDLRDIWLDSAGIGLRLDVTNLPQQHSPLPVQQFAEGYEMTLNPHVWRVPLDCVPAEPYGVMTLDTETCVLSSSVDDDDTSWSVHHTAPPIWDDDLPQIWMQCDGERSILATDVATTAITFVGAGAATHANNASVTPALPASVAARDLLVIVVAIRSSGTGTINAPSGYEVMAGWHNFAVLGKIHDGSESDPTVTFTGGSAGDDTSAFMFALRGTIQDPVAAVVEKLDWLNPAGQDIAFPPMAAPHYDGCAVIVAGWKQDDWTSVAALAGMSEIAEPDTTTGSDQGIVADYVIQTTAAAVASGSFAVTGGGSAISRGIILAIAPGLQTLTVTRGTPAAAHSAGEQVRVDHIGNVAL
jgi:hypothetical protein